MKNNPLVSIIIPTRNSEEFIDACLLSIKKQSYKNIEIIVVDNNSSDNTKKIAKKYTVKVFNKGPERSAQRNFGAKQGDGEYVLFVDSDMELDKKVIEECIDAIKKDNKILAEIIPEESYGEGFWAQCKKLERSFYIGVDWMEGARFFKKNIFNEMNGYDETITGTEDYDLPQRIKGKYGIDCIGRISRFIYHNEGKLSLIKSIQKKFYYAQNIDIYKKNRVNAVYLTKQASLIERYKLFFLSPYKLFKRPFIGLGMLILKMSELIAAGLGYIYYAKK